jgi:hypothetical protein
MGFRCWLLMFVAVMSACGGGGASSTTQVRDAAFVDPRAELCSGTNDGASTSPTFEVIQEVFVQNCVSCHTTASDLDLSVGHAWANLVGQAAPRAESCGGTLVVPGNPSGSYLYQKISAPTPCSGLQMPRGDFGSEPLPDCLVTLVRAWIAGGALESSSDAARD